MLVMVAHSGGTFSPAARSILQGCQICYSSDEVFLLAGVPGILEGRVTLQGCIGTLCKLCAFGFIGVVGALVPVQVAKHEKEEADKDQGHRSDHSCNDGNLHNSVGHPWVRFQALRRWRSDRAVHGHAAAGRNAVGRTEAGEWGVGVGKGHQLLDREPGYSVAPRAPTPRR